MGTGSALWLVPGALVVGVTDDGDSTSVDDALRATASLVHGNLHGDVQSNRSIGPF